MKFSSQLIVFFLIAANLIYSQKTYFIKYKNNVSTQMVEQRVNQQKISNAIGDRPLSMPEFKLSLLADGIGMLDDNLSRIVKITFTDNINENSFNSIISSDPDIEYVQKSIIYKLDVISNDSLITQQWALSKIGAYNAWNISLGADSVLMGIIDTGIDYNHPDIKDKLFLNSNEVGTDNFGGNKSNNGIDDDGNGFIDDYRGWDFTDRVGFPFDSTGGDYLNWDNNPFDEQGHGTFIAGISNSIFIGDLNKNGVSEIAFPKITGIDFYEFGVSTRTNTPFNLTGFSISNDNIQLSWTGNVAKYYIYKSDNKENLVLIDSTSLANYIDDNVLINKNYYYTVQAFDPLKPEPLSNLSNIVGVYSHAPAKPVSVVNTSSRSIIVSFSDKINTVIENLQSFEIPTVGFPNSISSNNQFSYLLSFKDKLPDGGLKLIIKDINDFYNSPISADTLTFFVTTFADTISFYITAFEILSPFQIKISFNIKVDETSTLNPDNYIFEPVNHVTSVTIDPIDARTIYLNMNNQKPIGSIGMEYILRINNLLSDKFSGNIPITKGAGSYIVLSSFAKNLSDVYVYPNPVHVDDNIVKLTFANLPIRAKITIWTIDGKKVNELDEEDGNGGLDYNLKDEEGRDIGSGIYIYRIIQLDDQSNETEEKIGKFAILR